jgi:hypothetical protein
MPSQRQFEKGVTISDDFRLSAAQLVFMVNAENAMRKAEAEDDIQFFRDLAASNEYRALFGAMSIDQAIDRYELMTGVEI